MSMQRIWAMDSCKASFLLTLSTCASNAALMEGKLVHDMVTKDAFENDTMINTSMLKMYGKCGSLDEAKNVFDRVYVKDIILWNAMISIYAQSGLGKEAITLFSLMLWEGERPNEATFVGLLSASSCHDVSPVQSFETHIYIIECGLDSELILGNALVTAYGKKHGSLDRAREAFDRMHEHNVVSWNVIISMYAQHGKKIKALSLFVQTMMEGIIPNKATFVIYLSSCTTTIAIVSSRTSFLNEVKAIHAQILSSVGVDTVLGNSLVHVYGRCKSSKAAWEVFNIMQEQSLVTWTTMLASYSQDGQGSKALQMFDRMYQEGIMADKVALISVLDSCNKLADGDRVHVKAIGCGYLSDAVVATAIIKMYGKCNNIDKSKSVFYDMVERSEISWSTMLTAFAENGLDKESLLLYRNMQQEGLVVDSFTLGSLLDACASQASLTDGIWVHASNIVKTKYESNVIVGTALLNLYGKCGCITHAHRSFNKLTHKDLIAWNALIASYAQHGHAKEVFEFLIQMQKDFIVPNAVTFISVLSACSHAGFISEGFWCSHLMCRKHHITHTLEHYDCIIDLLSRAGMLSEAEILIRKMPLQPTAISLMPLLSACRYQSDINRANRIAWSIFSKYPENAGSYVVLANIYSMVGDGAEEPTNITDGQIMVSLLPWQEEVTIV